MSDIYAELSRHLKTESALERLAALYGCGNGELVCQLSRYTMLCKRHEEVYRAKGPLYMLSAPGRTELIGNHTDHNRGRVLASAITLDMVACVSARDDMIAHVDSEGFPAISLDLGDLAPVKSEEGTSAAVVRGTAARMRELGYKIGGFDACVTSNVLGGSGLSSSAAYEVLMLAVQDALYNGFIMQSTERAEIAQYAENHYFGKPCGLMDQMASSTGGLVGIDFKNEPIIEPLPYSFKDKGYSMIVVKTGGSHDDLTADYAAIREEMSAVAEALGESCLRRVRPEQITQNVARLRETVGDRAVLRAMHFFEENKRVKQAVSALRADDIELFFKQIIASGESSWMLLQNVYTDARMQPLSLALALAASMLAGKGAWRVHGGGFAGTTLNFVPCGMVKTFVSQMESAFGANCCAVLDVRSEGAAAVFRV